MLVVGEEVAGKAPRARSASQIQGRGGQKGERDHKAAHSVQTATKHKVTPHSKSEEKKTFKSRQKLETCLEKSYYRCFLIGSKVDQKKDNKIESDSMKRRNVEDPITLLNLPETGTDRLKKITTSYYRKNCPK